MIRLNVFINKQCHVKANNTRKDSVAINASHGDILKTIVNVGILLPKMH